MTGTGGRSMSGSTSTGGVLQPGRSRLGASAEVIRKPERLIFALPLAGAAVGAVVGGGALASDGVDGASVPALGVLALSLLVALAYRRIWAGTFDRSGLLLLGLCLAAAVVLVVLPEWMYGWNVNGIVNRSVFSAPLLLVLSTAAGAHSLRSLLGASPSGQDLSLYPWLALPIVLALVAYGMVLGRVIVSGIGGLRLDLLTTAWSQDQTLTGQITPGFLNSILGTFLLMAMTLLIAFLPGVGAGVFVSEYPGRLAGLIDFCTQMLRAVSMFVIGAAAFGLVHLMNSWDPGSLLSQLVRGSHTDAVTGLPVADKGSFLLAAVFLALLVVPVIAKLTEEGLRSVPREIREGSIALGATDGQGLRRILLPWATPNILTGLLLAGAEANGSLAVIIFLAGTGENGIGPTSGVTSLDYAVFATKYGTRAYSNSMQTYQYTAALLLLIVTLGLTVTAMVLQQRFAKRYRGSMTSN